jgi:hypothetical protein
MSTCAALVLGRRATGKLGEPGAERPEAGEPDNNAHLGDGEISAPEELAGTLNPAPGQIVARSRAVRCTEGADEVVAGVPRVRSQGAEIERTGEVAVNEVSGAAQALQPGGVW